MRTLQGPNRDFIRAWSLFVLEILMAFKPSLMMKKLLNEFKRNMDKMIGCCRSINVKITLGIELNHKIFPIL